jgi:hypothetical protein
VYIKVRTIYLIPFSYGSIGKYIDLRWQYP